MKYEQCVHLCVDRRQTVVKRILSLTFRECYVCVCLCVCQDTVKGRTICWGGCWWNIHDLLQAGEQYTSTNIVVVGSVLNKLMFRAKYYRHGWMWTLNSTEGVNRKLVRSNCISFTVVRDQGNWSNLWIYVYGN